MCQTDAVQEGHWFTAQLLCTALPKPVHTLVQVGMIAGEIRLPATHQEVQ